MSVYTQALGSSFSTLPTVLHALHSGQSGKVDGVLNVIWGKIKWVNFLLGLSTLPRAQNAMPCSVRIRPQNENTERWERDMGGRPMISVMRVKKLNTITEQIGPFRILLNTRLFRSGITQKSQRIDLLGMPIPGVRIYAKELALTSSSYYCHVKLAVWGVGCILQYKGILHYTRTNF